MPWRKWTLRTAGLCPEQKLQVIGVDSQCGNLSRGVAFDLGFGVWVVNLDDLRRVVREADEVQKKNDEADHAR